MIGAILANVQLGQVKTKAGEHPLNGEEPLPGDAGSFELDQQIAQLPKVSDQIAGAMVIAGFS